LLRLPKDQDCHELWSRMMKKALRERMSRPADDNSSALDARSASSTYSKITTSTVSATTGVTTVSSHSCSSTYSKNTVSGIGSYSVAAISSDLNLLTHHQSWTHRNVGSQRPVSSGHSDRPASSSSSLHRTDSSNLTPQPVVTGRSSLRHSASHTHANHH